SDEDVEAVINAIKDGTLDCIVTDHAPHAEEDKNLEFDRAANGISGLETSLAAAYTYLVKPGHISMRKLVEIMSKNPARVIRIEENRLMVGAKANLTIFNPDLEWIVDSSKFYSKGKNTPFNSKKLYGFVEATVVNGKLIYMKETGICL
ncbi:MAG: amidohydrolase family protein, partial [Candidatus Afipia apatlaquensis]|nr:amidohydrolase family protein [Candidatus Afipia apatlaquensis]